MTIARRTLLGSCIAAASASAAGCSPTPAASRPSADATTSGSTAAPRVFPSGFGWGVATSAFQIEGSPAADGRTPSIWDAFTAVQGRIADGSNASVACDHYRRWEADLDLMKKLGIRSYRFSISWPRVLPSRSAGVNPAGLGFYDRLVDGLVARGITPVATLFHWDLPVYLQQEGGWENRDSAGWFVDYAQKVFAKLGDRVGSWATINETKIIAQMGYQQGTMAPGLRDQTASGKVVHHLNLAHGRAVQAFRASGARGRIGPCFALSPCYPADPSVPPATVDHIDLQENRLYLDPILRGSYPDQLDTLDSQFVQGLFGAVRSEDAAVIGEKVDFAGFTYYSPAVIGSGGPVQRYPVASSGWQQIYPQGLKDLLVRLHRDYKAPEIVVLENGLPDARGGDPLTDSQRVDFLRGHLTAAHDAISEGVRLTGFHVWSLLDNFEWAQGYSQRFGLVRVDFDSQQRVPKASAAWYAGVIAANGITG
ncbi:MAG TPA: GH1 family beta-glucosidase [Propionibacteriaceae bacterium]|nr:GH1 family beta-glucosidase [Propionibacteriaceae bacterium]